MKLQTNSISRRNLTWKKCFSFAIRLSRQQWLVTLLGLMVSIVTTWFIVHDIDWNLLSRALTNPSWKWFLPSIGCLGFVVLLKARRWQAVLASPVPMHLLLQALVIGYMGNTILPARLGEVLRIWVLQKRAQTGVSIVVGSIVAEKVLDIVVLTFSLTLTAVFVDLPPWLSIPIQSLGMMLVLLLILFFIAGHRFPALLETLFRFLPPDWRGRGLDMLLQLRQPVIRLVRYEAASLWIQTIIIWLLTFLFAWLVMQFSRIQANPWAALVLIAATSLGMVIPSSPGYLGVYHGIVQGALLLFGVERESALSYAVVLHLITFAPLTMLGAFWLMRFASRPIATLNVVWDAQNSLPAVKEDRFA